MRSVFFDEEATNCMERVTTTSPVVERLSEKSLHHWSGSNPGAVSFPGAGSHGTSVQERGEREREREREGETGGGGGGEREGEREREREIERERERDRETERDTHRQTESEKESVCERERE